MTTLKALQRLGLTASSDEKDSVSFDIPLFIRLLEVAREELKTDAELHDLVERVISRQKVKGVALTMDDYPSLYTDSKSDSDLNPSD
jgi:hypothetical protein